MDPQNLPQPVSPQPQPVQSTPVAPLPPQPSHKKLFLILLGVVILAVVGTLSFYFFSNRTLLLSKLDMKLHPSPTPKPGCFYQQVECFQAPCPPILICPTTTPIPTVDPTANWKTYSNPTFGYSFKYPADYKSLPNLGENIFYSPNVELDKTTRAKTKGLELGSTVYNPGEDPQKYIGPNTKSDTTLVSKLVLPEGFVAKTYVNPEDITVTIDYENNNKNMRIIIWCGGANGNSAECKNVLTPVLSTLKFTNQKSQIINTYENTEYMFAFDLTTNERVVVCPNKNDLNDNVALWATTDPKLSNNVSECGRGGTFDSVFASKKGASSVSSVESYISSLQQDYHMTQSPITVSGAAATKIKGILTRVAPLDSTLDQIVIMHNGIFYSFSNRYLQKNFRFLN